MLILTRKIGDTVVIGDEVSIRVLAVESHDRVKLGCSAPEDVSIYREEIYQKIQKIKSVNLPNTA